MIFFARKFVSNFYYSNYQYRANKKALCLFFFHSEFQSEIKRLQEEVKGEGYDDCRKPVSYKAWYQKLDC